MEHAKEIVHGAKVADTECKIHECKLSQIQQQCQWKRKKELEIQEGICSAGGRKQKVRDRLL